MNRAIVLKIGGSLMRSGAARELMQAIAARPLLAPIIVPGGGMWADHVREEQQRLGFSDVAAHRMALHAMDAGAALLADFAAPAARVCEIADDFDRAPREGRIAIWAPSRMALAATDIPARWDVTSDSLAAWLAMQLRVERLILVKSCEIPALIASDANALTAAGIVDAAFPAFMRNSMIDWKVVPGTSGALHALDTG
ncbi:MAG: aspartate kinase [Burkholderiales bacterium]|nr:aspartate kinase [Burkholderiales bacterium]